MRAAFLICLPLAGCLWTWPGELGSGTDPSATDTDLVLDSDGTPVTDSPDDLSESDSTPAATSLDTAVVLPAGGGYDGGQVGMRLVRTGHP